MQDVIRRLYAHANKMEDQRQIMGDVLNMEPEARGTLSQMFSPHVQSFSSLDLQGYIGMYSVGPNSRIN